MVIAAASELVILFETDPTSVSHKLPFLILPMYEYMNNRSSATEKKDCNKDSGRKRGETMMSNT